MEMTILHLSDIHFKRKSNETFREDVKEKMIDAIKRHLDTGERGPDFAAITGDIAFSGKEYDEAGSFFADLKSQLPGEIKFLAVPGNHDVDRDEISAIFSLHSIVQNKEKIDRLLENPKEINTHINTKTKAFRAFVQDLHPGLYRSEKDYFWVKNFKDKRVSFLGLNSCWACEDDNDRNNITLGYPQVMTAIKQAIFSNRVLLMHHPPINWLNEVDFNRYSGEIFKKCGLILHGHTHTDNALVFKSLSGSCMIRMGLSGSSLSM